MTDVTQGPLTRIADASVVPSSQTQDLQLGGTSGLLPVPVSSGAQWVPSSVSLPLEGMGPSPLSASMEAVTGPLDPIPPVSGDRVIYIDSDAAPLRSSPSPAPTDLSVLSGGTITQEQVSGSHQAGDLQSHLNAITFNMRSHEIDSSVTRSRKIFDPSPTMSAGPSALWRTPVQRPTSPTAGVPMSQLLEGLARDVFARAASEEPPHDADGDVTTAHFEIFRLWKDTENNTYPFDWDPVEHDTRGGVWGFLDAATPSLAEIVRILTDRRLKFRSKWASWSNSNLDAKSKLLPFLLNIQLLIDFLAECDIFDWMPHRLHTSIADRDDRIDQLLAEGNSLLDRFNSLRQDATSLEQEVARLSALNASLLASNERLTEQLSHTNQSTDPRPRPGSSPTRTGSLPPNHRLPINESSLTDRDAEGDTDLEMEAPPLHVDEYFGQRAPSPPFDDGLSDLERARARRDALEAEFSSDSDEDMILVSHASRENSRPPQDKGKGKARPTPPPPKRARKRTPPPVPPKPEGFNGWKTASHTKGKKRTFAQAAASRPQTSREQSPESPRGRTGAPSNPERNQLLFDAMQNLAQVCPEAEPSFLLAAAAAALGMQNPTANLQATAQSAGAGPSRGRGQSSRRSSPSPNPPPPQRPRRAKPRAKPWGPVDYQRVAVAKLPVQHRLAPEGRTPAGNLVPLIAARVRRMESLNVATAARWSGDITLEVRFLEPPTTQEMRAVQEIVAAQIPGLATAAVEVQPARVVSRIRIDDVSCRDPNVLDPNTFEPSVRTFDQMRQECALNPALSKAMFDGSKVTLLCTNPQERDRCPIIVDINDSRAGTTAQQLYGKAVILFGERRLIRAFVPLERVQQCSRCYKWRHSARTCTETSQRCPKCWELHSIEHHAALGSCCRPIQPGEGRPAVCPHAPRCINCGEGHKANSAACIFKKKSTDKRWHDQHKAMGHKNPKAPKGNPPSDGDDQPGPSKRRVRFDYSANTTNLFNSHDPPQRRDDQDPPRRRPKKDGHSQEGPQAGGSRRA